MKSPMDLARRLSRQWENGDLRERRILGGQKWPIVLSIGRPSSSVATSNMGIIKKHVEMWRRVKHGEVCYSSIKYRDVSREVMIPTEWKIHSCEEWILAANDADITSQHDVLQKIVNEVDPLYHSLFIRKRNLWSNKPLSEVIRAVHLADSLSPGCADGSPLRAISCAGIDSKFFERHRSLVLQLLDLRFDFEPSKQGLEVFLGAWQENDHWLLVADLDGGILPFFTQRVPSKELLGSSLAPRNLLIVENEKCLHVLPPLKDTVAILGSGYNLSFLDAEWIGNTNLGYWGDIDTWGLVLLAKAREKQPDLSPILMTEAIFQHHKKNKAVEEPVIATSIPPGNLSTEEKSLYEYLISQDMGRLEQEFLPKQTVFDVLTDWAKCEK